MSICARTIRRTCALAMMSALMSCLDAAILRAEPRYNITALDVLPGGLDSLAFGLNDRGQVVGDSKKDRTGNVGQSRPVVWSYSGQPTELWSDQFIGASLAGINNSGEIVGRYGSGSGIPLPTPGVLPGRAFVWNATAGRRDLGLQPFGNSMATAINDNGQVSGTSEMLETVIIDGSPMDVLVPRAFVWDAAGGIRDIGTLGGHFEFTFANAINNLGQVIGYGGLADGNERAFVWDEAAGMRELPTIAGGSTRAVAINDLGQVLGSEIGVGGVIWDLNTATQRVVPGGSDLNNVGQTVGGTSIWDETNGRRLLSGLIPAGTGWQLEFAFAINDGGDIVGYGLLDDEVRGFLMTPVPEPATLRLLASASVAAAFFVLHRARRRALHPQEVIC